MEANALDKIQLEELKKSKYREASFYFSDLIRGRSKGEDSLEHLVVGSTLALKLKEFGKEGLMGEIQRDLSDETVLRSLKNVWNDLSSEIENYSDRFSEKDLKGAVLLSEPSRYSEVNVTQTPDGINKLSIALLELEKEDRVMDLGSGVASFLTEAALSVGTEHNYGVEINSTSVVISKLRQYVTGLPFNIIQGNMISKDYSHLKANKVFSNFPLGMRYNDLKAYMDNNEKLTHYFDTSSRVSTGDWVFAMAAYLNTSMPGKTVFLMTNAGTYNSSDAQFRRELIEKRMIEGIIQLPANLMSSTAIPLTLIVLSENNEGIKMVDASEIFTSGRRKNTLEENDIEQILKAYDAETEISRIVSDEEIKHKDYIINPSRYIGVEDLENGIELGEIASKISRGSMIKSSQLDELVSDEDTPYHYLMLQNIQDGIIDESLPSLVKLDKDLEKYCIKNNNLIISKNAPFKVALAKVSEEEQILANGNLYFIDLNPHKVNPTFVLAYFLNEEGQAQLNQFSKGSVMKNISIKDLKKVQIPNLNKSEQNRIAEKYEELTEHFIMLEKQMTLVRNKRMHLFEEVL